MFIDTHCHPYVSQFEEDRHEMILRAKEAGVALIIQSAIDIPSIEKALVLAEKYEGLYVLSGIHPCDTKDLTEADFKQVEEFCKHPKVVGIGETGLDYYWDRSYDEIQQYWFRRHIQLAITLDLPLIIHNREATTDCLRILNEEGGQGVQGGQGEQGRSRGIFHCFDGSEGLLEGALALGFLLGIGGSSTYKKSTVLDQVAQLDLKHLVLETDAPFLAPVPFRGKRNESSYIPHIAQALADKREVNVSVIAKETTANAKRLFKLERFDR